MAKILGKNLVITMGGTAVGAAKDCSLEYSVDTEEIASAQSGTAKEFVLKRSQWSLSVSGLVLNRTLSALMTAIKTTQRTATLAVTFTDGTNTYSGNAYLTSIRVSGSVGSVAAYNATLQGTGELA